MMDSASSDHLTQILSAALSNWPLFAFSFGMIVGWVIWAMYKVFPTHAVMDNCRKEIMMTIRVHEEAELRRSEVDKKDLNNRLNKIDTSVASINEFLRK